MRNHKKYLILLALILMTISVLGSATYADKTLSFQSMNAIITINGKKVNFNNDMGHPMLTNTKRTLVPLRIISENMGYKVDWSENTWHQGIKKVWINDDKTKVELEIGKIIALVNGITKYIDVDDQGNPVNTKSMLIKDRTYVPLRFITEALGGEIKYELKNGVHYIDIITGKEQGIVIEDNKDWIEPILKIGQYPYRTENKHFYIELVNYKDYAKFEDKGFSISSVLQGYEHLRKYRGNDVLEPGLTIYNDDSTYSNWDYRKVRLKNGLIYEFMRLTHKYNLDNDKKVTPPKIGEMLTIKVTLKIGNKSKDYFLEAAYEEKDFILK